MELDVVVVLSRVLHLMGAMMLFGGGLYVRNVLTPASKTLSDDIRPEVLEANAKRWRIYVAVSIAILIFTGFYNYLAIMRPLHPGDKVYHMWMGIKILLAFVVFFFASALAGRSKALQGIRRNAGMWMTFTTIVGTIVIVIASVLKTRGLSN
ncbi:MAG: hypothetical protein KDA80_18600 [Planctomycetaceae bacterium]|nr:hypothetical protein [Planctomycetaceae bacterium]